MAITMNTTKIIKVSADNMIIGHCNDLEVQIIGNNTKTPSLSMTYKDPEIEGVPYGGTVVVIKEGSYPENEKDGFIVIDIMEKNKHSTTPLVVELPIDNYNLSKDIYVKLFPYGTNKAYNNFGKEKFNSNIIWAKDTPVALNISQISLPTGKNADVVYHPTDPSKLLLLSMDYTTLYEYNIETATVGDAYVVINNDIIKPILEPSEIPGAVQINSVKPNVSSRYNMDNRSFIYPISSSKFVFIADISYTNSGSYNTNGAYLLLYDRDNNTASILRAITQSNNSYYTNSGFGTTGYNLYQLDDNLIIETLFDYAVGSASCAQSMFLYNEKEDKIYNLHSVTRGSNQFNVGLHKILSHGVVKTDVNEFKTINYSTDSISLVYEHSIPSNPLPESKDSAIKTLTEQTIDKKFIQLDSYVYLLSLSTNNQCPTIVKYTTDLTPIGALNIGEITGEDKSQIDAITYGSGYTICTNPDRGFVILKDTKKTLSKALIIKAVY